MAVTTTKTNKPINPRGNDQSPKGYNRAALYSGKALDFDGVNDYINEQTISVSSTSFAVSFYVRNDALLASAACGVSIGPSSGYDLVVYPFDSSSGGLRIFKSGIGNIVTNVASRLNVFEHYVIQSDGSNLSVYQNGELAQSVSFTTAITYTRLQLGALIGNIQFFEGQMAGFKLFNTALTAAQVSDLYNNPEKIVPTGVEDTALKLWLPMMEGAGTTAYDGSGNALGSEEITNGDFATDSDWTKETGWTISGGKATFDGSVATNALFQNIGGVSGKRYILSFEVTDYVSGSVKAYLSNGDVSGGTPSITANGKYVFDITATGVLCLFRNETSFNGSIDNVSVKELTSYGVISGATWTHGIGAPVSQSAVIDWNKWPLDGSNNALIPQGLTAGRDLLGNLFENVRKQGALNLDGNSWAEVHDNASLDMTTTATMEVWINANELDGFSHHIFVKSSQSFWTGNYGRYVLRASENNVNWWFDDFTTNSKVYTISLSGWNHLAVTKDGTAEKLYINGALVATETGAATFTASTFPLLIGSRTGYGEFFKSDIAQPRIYNRALTAEEVERNYNAGKNIYK